MYAEALATISLLINLAMVFYLIRFKRRMGPLITRAFTLLGTLGSQERWNDEKLKEAETLIVQGAMDKIPELKLLAETFPEVKTIIEERPEITIALWEKWGPLIEKLLIKKPKPESYGV
jgi:hypothetical protein